MKLTAKVGDRVHEVTILRRDASFVVTVDGSELVADARKLGGDAYSILVRGRSYTVSVEANGDAYCVRRGAAKQVVTLTDPSRSAREGGLASAAGPAHVVSVMPGKVVRILVAVGDRVEAGQGLVVVEAMKMENEIASPKAGRVAAIPVEAGRPVDAGAILVVLE